MKINFNSEELKRFTNLAVKAKTDRSSFDILYTELQPLIVNAVIKSNKKDGDSKFQTNSNSQLGLCGASRSYIGESDLYQDISVALFKSIRNYNPEKNDNFVAYFDRVTRNTVAYYYRKNSENKNLNKTDECGVEMIDYVEAPKSYNPAYDYEYNESIKIIENDLNGEEKAILSLYIVGFTTKEISKKIGKHQSSVYRARDSIKKAAEKLTERVDEVGPYRGFPHPIPFTAA